MMRFILALLFLALAFVMQFWLSSVGIFINFIFAVLIACSYLFDIWDILVFLLLALFVINWQPTWSPELFVFTAVTLIGYAIHKYSAWQAWAANAFTIALGFLIFYLAIAPDFLLHHADLFLIDLAAGLVCGSIVFAALNRREER